MNEVLETNLASISGKIISVFEFSHEVYGEKFFKTYVEVKRLSEKTDTIPIMVSDRLLDMSKNYTGCDIMVSGQFRSYNRQDGEKRHLELYLFVNEISFQNEYNQNFILLDGHICKTPVYRVTPFGREICDLMLAVNREYGKTDYIPCIAWGRNARFANNLEVGNHILIQGRIQSREYRKNEETKVAYEVSIMRLEVLENENQN